MIDLHFERALDIFHHFTDFVHGEIGIFYSNVASSRCRKKLDSTAKFNVIQINLDIFSPKSPETVDIVSQNVTSITKEHKSRESVYLQTELSAAAAA